MKFEKIMVAAAIMMSAGTSHAWNLVYAHDGNGNATLGSLQALRSAARNGASVKVIAESPGIQYWNAPCAQVAIRDDATQAVVCLGNVDLLVDINQGPQFGVVLSPPRSANYAANTNGQYGQTDVQISNGAILSQTTRRYTMNWYVE